MGPCHPEYRKTVDEEEKKVNEKGKDSVPLFVRIISLLIVVGAVGMALYLW
ncbi:hypothetical protein M3182_07660 [Mesobacillus maritimus]|uniref:hypothetical protein n=1 Tax=Mesobacillus maritimus TaxID=1643336 RepID=UPI00203E3E18|nr:hypothetical protein [Mesobacillus maritimus]MCM3585624.1 hypothetical protein [Mesobacillus maritimus]MCM3669096.1 hypothetical protein [Mesobacillus maritimus]